MRRHLLENQSLPENRKYEIIFTVFSYGSGQMLLEVRQRKRGEQVPVRQNKSVLKPHYSGVMLLFPGKLIIRLLVHFQSGLTILGLCVPENPLFSMPEPKKTASVTGEAQGPDKNSGSKKSLSLAKGWLTECRSHSLCNRDPQKESNMFVVPTRLLHVGTTKHPDLRLCRVPDSTEYASLSHCWGKHVPVKLLSSNVAAFHEFIEITGLPRTFREAIEVARHLKIEYLWIDSLCIIQDSKDDWASEAALMHQVYANAIVNIAADDARDGTEGLFRDRDPRLCELVEVEVSWTEQHRGIYKAVDNALWQSTMEASVLNSRAWVLQEQLLSARILHFGQTQLLWECQTAKACELFPAGLYEVHSGYGPKKSIKKAEAMRPFTLEQGGDLGDERVVIEYSQRWEAHRQWKDIVDDCTNRNLTFGTDKLVSISALAKRFGSANFRTEYLAGLWNQDLAVQLLWSPARLQLKSRPTTRQTEYRAPTWSWASIDGRILPGTPGLYPKQKNILINIHEAKTTLASSDPFGAVKDGHLVISGRITRVLLLAAGAAVTQFEGTASYNLQVCAGSTQLIPEGTAMERLHPALKDCTYEDGEAALDAYEAIYFVPVSDECEGGQFGKNGSAGILLQREEDSTSCFRRFGMYQCHFDDMPLFEQGYDFFDSSPESTGFETQLDEMSHRKMYKITII
jgi:hypothetical protein